MAQEITCDMNFDLIGGQGLGHGVFRIFAQ